MSLLHKERVPDTHYSADSESSLAGSHGERHSANRANNAEVDSIIRDGAGRDTDVSKTDKEAVAGDGSVSSRLQYPLHFPSLSTHFNCSDVAEYEKVDRIGEGTYGTVYRAIYRRTRTVVALKRVLLHNESTEGFPITTLREISVLRLCKNHRNCVQLLDVVVGKRRDAVFLVFEYCEHDIYALIRKYKSPFTEAELKCLFLQLLQALSYLHKHDIVHRDLKLSNLLYTCRGELKLADFGMSRELNFSDTTPMTTKVVTLWYRAPEILLEYGFYSTAVDMWAVGCLFGELLASKPLFPGDSESDQIQYVFDVLGVPNERVWPEVNSMPLISNCTVKIIPTKENVYNNLRVLFPAISEDAFEFLNLCLAYNPRNRIKAKHALTHMYFLRSPYPLDPSLMPTFPSCYGEIPQQKWDKIGKTDEFSCAKSNGSNVPDQSAMKKRKSESS
jgi:cyclin-dependent kinase 10